MQEKQASWALPAPVQGRDSITVDRPAAQLWPLIADSTQLTPWGPPVVAVEVLDHPETVGSRRRIDATFGKKTGSFGERRIIHDGEHLAMAFVIEEDSFGIGKLLTNVGSLMELQPVTESRTVFVWSFFHQPRGVLGRVMNRLVILRQQRQNRLRALESFKAFVERGVTPTHTLTRPARRRPRTATPGPGGSSAPAAAPQGRVPHTQGGRSGCCPPPRDTPLVDVLERSLGWDGGAVPGLPWSPRPAHRSRWAGRP